MLNDIYITTIQIFTSKGFLNVFWGVMYATTLFMFTTHMFRPLSKFSQAPVHFIPTYFAIYSMSIVTKLIQIIFNFAWYYFWWWLLYRTPYALLSSKYDLVALWNIPIVEAVNSSIITFWIASIFGTLFIWCYDWRLKVREVNSDEFFKLIKKYKIPLSKRAISNIKICSIKSTKMDNYRSAFTYSGLFFRPRICFTESMLIPRWEKAMLAIFLHEYAHIRGGDSITLMPYNSLNAIRYLLDRINTALVYIFSKIIFGKVVITIFNLLIIFPINFCINIFFFIAKITDSISSRYCEIFADLEASQQFGADHLICALGDLERNRYFNTQRLSTNEYAKQLTEESLKAIAEEAGTVGEKLNTYLKNNPLKTLINQVVTSFKQTYHGESHPRTIDRIILLSNFSEYIMREKKINNELKRLTPKGSILSLYIVTILFTLSVAVHQLYLYFEYRPPIEITQNTIKEIKVGSETKSNK